MARRKKYAPQVTLGLAIDIAQQGFLVKQLANELVIDNLIVAEALSKSGVQLIPDRFGFSQMCIDAGSYKEDKNE